MHRETDQQTYMSPWCGTRVELDRQPVQPSRIANMEGLSSDQLVRENILKEVSEVMLMIEVAAKRTDTALTTLKSGDLSNDPNNATLLALEDAKHKLDALRRMLYQKGYLASSQLDLF
ncbi:hypothetical protein [Ferrimicrobium sp.]|uniref:hypothetical protein n=1 Tax=Ferrimicrobium sp. TaxID=2926050 RepID=UPI002613A689|nr:hypothetical protein [Ferrimicrobium sp.]